MAAIIPQGTIWLLKNIPLDNTYQHTLYWELNINGRYDQTDYFLSSSHIVGQPLTNQTYTRVNNNRIRVARLADDILLANYLVFCNSDSNVSSPKYSNKLYFCFITSINYINNNVTEIEFEIDVIQTWYFDFNLLPCFMERTHARNDAKYSNIVPEPVEVGEYTYQMIYNETVTRDLALIVAVVTVDNGVSKGKLYGKIYGGCTLFACLPNDTVAINAKLSEYVQAPDSVVAVYMCPKCLLNVEFEPGTMIELTSSMVKTGTNVLNTAFPDPDQLTDFGSYTPHNNKLYSYPYTMFEVFTAEGEVADYRYEFFNNHTPNFLYGGSITSPVSLNLIPNNYKVAGESLSQTMLLTESVTIKDYPICSWNSDTYKAWVAQNGVPFALDYSGALLHGATSMLAGMAVGGAVGGVLAGIHTAGNLFSLATNTMKDAYRASIAADKLHGGASGSANVSMQTQGYYFAHKVVNESSARIIDSFFDMFGYAVKKIQEPIRKTRAFYTFVKTLGCVIEEKQWVSNPAFANTGIPADDANKICELHDAGITYWDVANLEENGTIGGKTYHVGDYSIAPYNSPIG